MKKLLHAAIIASCCLQFANTMETAADGKFLKNPTEITPESDQMVAGMLINWVETYIPKNSLGAFDQWITSYAVYLRQSAKLLQEQDVQLVGAQKESIAKKLAALKDQAVQHIPEKLYPLFHDKFRKELLTLTRINFAQNNLNKAADMIDRIHAYIQPEVTKHKEQGERIEKDITNLQDFFSPRNIVPGGPALED